MIAFQNQAETPLDLSLKRQKLPQLQLQPPSYSAYEDYLIYTLPTEEQPQDLRMKSMIRCLSPLQTDCCLNDSSENNLIIDESREELNASSVLVEEELAFHPTPPNTPPTSTPVRRIVANKVLSTPRRILPHSPNPSEFGLVERNKLVMIDLTEDCLSETEEVAFLEVEEPKMLLLANNPTQNSAIPNKYKCDYCDKTYPKRFDAKQHMREYHLTDRQTTRCRKCDGRFDTPKELAAHLKTHDPTVGEFKCYQCGKQFVHKTNLQRHFRTNHNDVRTFDCSGCMERFVDYDVYTEHVLRCLPFGRK